MVLLTQDQVALVAAADHERLTEMGSWYAHWNPHTKSFYAAHTGPRPRQVRFRMHNVIWEWHNGPIPEGFTVDHANHASLDNCPSNLRLATKSQQIQNQGLRSDNNSGYRGVSWNKKCSKWQAYISIDKKRIHIGYFDDPIDAALAYDAAAKIYHGEFAVLNFPP